MDRQEALARIEAEIILLRQIKDTMETLSRRLTGAESLVSERITELHDRKRKLEEADVQV